MEKLPDPTDTIPTPPPSEGPPVIPAGGARAALVHATARLAGEIERYTATAEAIARALDETDAGVRGARDALNATVTT